VCCGGSLQLFSGPVIILMILTFLGFIMGVSTILGVAVLIFSFPVSAIAFGQIIKHRIAQSKLTDKRLKKLSGMAASVSRNRCHTA